MDMVSAIAVRFLLGVSLLLGVKAVPPLDHNWSVIRTWTSVDGHEEFSAASGSIISECQANPNSYIHFPFIMHSGHILSVDGKTFYSTGNIDSSKSNNYYAIPEVLCKDIPNGSTLTWEVKSYSKYYSRFSKFPYISAEVPLGRFFGRTVNIAVGACLLMLGLYSFVIFNRKVSHGLAFSILFSNLLISIYFMFSNLEFFPFTIDVVSAHKYGTFGLWLGVIFLFRAFYEESLISLRAFYTITSILVSGLTIIGTSSNSDSVQLGGHFVFGPALVIVFLAAFNVFKLSKTSRFTRQSLLQLLSFMIFLIGSFNDIFFNLGLLNTFPLFSFGIFGSQFLFGLSVNNQIKQAYDERDYLRKNLELEVQKKTLELKQTQAELIQSAKLASLGTLSAGLAHEINNSINYVNGALAPLEKLVGKSISDAGEKNKITKLFTVMKDGLNLTVEIIRSLRNYSGLNQAKLNDLVLSDVINSVMTILRNRLKDSIKIVTEIEDGLYIHGNVVGLNQVFMNLITNALDAMPLGGELKITATKLGNTAKIEVSDTGTGISDSIKTRIFDPFFTTKDVGAGTGLGLHIVKNEIEKHHGSLDFRSVENQGTTFTITLPISSMDINEEKAG
jgi:signal transduction histidine kinase